MGKKSGNTYYANDEANRAAVILSSMSPDMVAQIGRLFAMEGSDSVRATLANNSSASTRVAPLAIFSREFVNDQDFEDVWRGVMVMLLAKLRTPNMGNDEYESILKQSYSLPAEMTAALAASIETRDLFSQAVKDAPWYSSFKNAISEGVRRALNYVPSLLNLPYEIDQTQDYDIDFLYEMKNLGSIVDDLNSRVSLMSGQALANQRLGVFATGDPEIGDIEDIESQIGDALSNVMMRQVPPSIFGNTGKIAALGLKASTSKLNELKDTAKDDSAPAKKIVAAKIIDKITSMSPGKAILIGSGLGLGAALISSLFKKKESGDVESELYGDIAEEYGPNVADAWLAGDIDEIVREGIEDASYQETTGDPDLDEAIFGDVIENEGEDESEAGGILSRWRTNRNIRRTQRRKRKRLRRAARENRRNRALNERLQSQRDMDDEGLIRPDQDDYQPDYNDAPEDDQDIYQVDQYNWGSGDVSNPSSHE